MVDIPAPGVGGGGGGPIESGAVVAEVFQDIFPSSDFGLVDSLPSPTVETTYTTGDFNGWQAAFMPFSPPRIIRVELLSFDQNEEQQSVIIRGWVLIDGEQVPVEETLSIQTFGGNGSRRSRIPFSHVSEVVIQGQENDEGNWSLGLTPRFAIAGKPFASSPVSVYAPIIIESGEFIYPDEFTDYSYAYSGGMFTKAPGLDMWVINPDDYVYVEDPDNDDGGRLTHQIIYMSAGTNGESE